MNEREALLILLRYVVNRLDESEDGKPLQQPLFSQRLAMETLVGMNFRPGPEAD